MNGTKKAYEELNGVLDRLAATVVQTLDQVVPYLAKMQSLLSQRGADRKKVLQRAGLPGWTHWAKAYAGKLDRSLRAIQDRIKQFRETRACGTGKAKSGSNGERVRLDSRQQAALVKAQVAANDLVAALKNGADWQTPLSEYEKVAVTPARLDTFMNALSPEPDWKAILTGLVTTLEQYGDRLPIPVITALKSTQELLDGKAKSQPVAKSGASTKRHLVPKKQEGGTTVHAMPLSGRVKESPGGTYGSESGVEAGCERLNSSPVAEPPIAGAAGVKQPEAAETRGGEPVFPGDWVTFDPTCKYLGRFVRRRGGSLVVMRWNRKPRYGQPAGWFQSTADGVYRRLTLEEVRERFPGALEAWGASQAATPEPALRPSSKMNTPPVSGIVPRHVNLQSAAQSAA